MSLPKYDPDNSYPACGHTEKSTVPVVLTDGYYWARWQNYNGWSPVSLHDGTWYALGNDTPLDRPFEVGAKLIPPPFDNGKRKVLHWKSRLTGFAGHGKPVSFAEAYAAMTEGAERWPHVEHWLEDEVTNG